MKIKKETMVTITPALAAHYLELNMAGNRDYRPEYARYLAEVIKGGRWIYNGNPIIFDEYGELQDGQHRLHACIIADMPIVSDITWGVPVGAYITQNSAKPMGFQDILKINGVAKYNVIASIIKRYFTLKKVRLEKDTGNTRLKIDNQYLFAFYEEHIDAITDAATIANRCYTNSNRVFSRSEVGGYIIFLQIEKGVPTSTMATFFDCAADTMKNNIMAAALLRKEMQQDFVRLRRLPSQARQAIFYKCINAYLNDKPIKRATYYEGDEYNFNNMQITNQLKIK